MPIDSGQKFKDAFVAFFAPDGDSTAETLVANMMKVRYRAHQAKDATIMNVNGNGITTNQASVAHVHTIDPSVPVRFKVSSFKLTAIENIAEANTDLATIQLVANNGNGGSDTVIATGNTAVGGGIGAVTSSIPVSFTVTAANALVSSGSCLQVKVTKSGAGKQLPELDFMIEGEVV